MLTPERHLQLAKSPLNVVESQGRAFINAAGTSIEIPLDDIPRIAAALLVSLERIQDAS